MQGFTAYNPDRNEIAVTFRGTATLKVLIADLVIDLVDYPLCRGCMVHRGFLTLYNSIAGTVHQHVQELMVKHPSASIRATGHSFGAAMAILATLDLQYVFGTVLPPYTFGQPRVGNLAFAKYLNKKTPAYRVVHYADLIPTLPPRVFNIGYMHGGT